MEAAQYSDRGNSWNAPTRFDDTLLTVSQELDIESGDGADRIQDAVLPLDPSQGSLSTIATNVRATDFSATCRPQLQQALRSMRPILSRKLTAILLVRLGADPATIPTPDMPRSSLEPRDQLLSKALEGILAPALERLDIWLSQRLAMIESQELEPSLERLLQKLNTAVNLRIRFRYDPLGAASEKPFKEWLATQPDAPRALYQLDEVLSEAFERHATQVMNMLAANPTALVTGITSSLVEAVWAAADEMDKSRLKIQLTDLIEAYVPTDLEPVAKLLEQHAGAIAKQIVALLGECNDQASRATKLLITCSEPWIADEVRSLAGRVRDQAATINPQANLMKLVPELLELTDGASSRHELSQQLSRRMALWLGQFYSAHAKQLVSIAAPPNIQSSVLKFLSCVYSPLADVMHEIDVFLRDAHTPSARFTHDWERDPHTNSPPQTLTGYLSAFSEAVGSLTAAATVNGLERTVNWGLERVIGPNAADQAIGYPEITVSRLLFFPLLLATAPFHLGANLCIGSYVYYKGARDVERSVNSIHPRETVKAYLSDDNVRHAWLELDTDNIERRSDSWVRAVQKLVGGGLKDGIDSILQTMIPIGKVKEKLSAVLESKVARWDLLQDEKVEELSAKVRPYFHYVELLEDSSLVERRASLIERDLYVVSVTIVGDKIVTLGERPSARDRIRSAPLVATAHMRMLVSSSALTYQIHTALAPLLRQSAIKRPAPKPSSINVIKSRTVSLEGVVGETARGLLHLLALEQADRTNRDIEVPEGIEDAMPPVLQDMAIINVLRELPLVGRLIERMGLHIGEVNIWEQLKDPANEQVLAGLIVNEIRDMDPTDTLAKALRAITTKLKPAPIDWAFERLRASMGSYEESMGDGNWASILSLKALCDSREKDGEVIRAALHRAIESVGEDKLRLLSLPNSEAVVAASNEITKVLGLLNRSLRLTEKEASDEFYQALNRLIEVKLDTAVNAACEFTDQPFSCVQIAEFAAWSVDAFEEIRPALGRVTSLLKVVTDRGITALDKGHLIHLSAELDLLTVYSEELPAVLSHVESPSVQRVLRGREKTLVNQTVDSVRQHAVAIREAGAIVRRLFAQFASAEDTQLIAAAAQKSLPQIDLPEPKLLKPFRKKRFRDWIIEKAVRPVASMATKSLVVPRLQRDAASMIADTIENAELLEMLSSLVLGELVDHLPGLELPQLLAGKAPEAQQEPEKLRTGMTLPLPPQEDDDQVENSNNA